MKIGFLFLFLGSTPCFSATCPCSIDSLPGLTRLAQEFRGAISGPDVVTGAPSSVAISGAKYTVVAFVSAKCPCSASHEVALRKLSQDFAKREIQFVGVHSNIDESADMTKAHFDHAKFAFPIIHDRNNELADLLGALKTPHVYVLGQTGKVIYQGGIDDSNNHANAKRHYLREVLTALVEGRESPLSQARTLGCVIKR